VFKSKWHSSTTPTPSPSNRRQNNHGPRVRHIFARPRFRHLPQAHQERVAPERGPKKTPPSANAIWEQQDGSDKMAATRGKQQDAQILNPQRLGVGGWP